jgi:hypothetical protein
MHLKTSAWKREDVPQFCLDNRIVGIGYRVGTVPISKEDYSEQGKAYLQDPLFKKRWPAAARAILWRILDGDVVWVRNKNALHYYVGKIKGDWKYLNGCDSEKHDVFNVRSVVDWKYVGLADSVPGPVLSSFISQRTIQRVDPKGTTFALNYSRYLLGEIEPSQVVSDPQKVCDLFTDEDWEDVVAVYLQHENRLLMYPSTCKRTRETVECLFTSSDGQHVGMQVKRGWSRINRDVYATFPGIVYLFQEHNQYTGQEYRHCITLSPDEIRRFVNEHRKLLPARIQQVLSLAGASTATQNAG